MHTTELLKEKLWLSLCFFNTKVGMGSWRGERKYLFNGWGFQRHCFPEQVELNRSWTDTQTQPQPSSVAFGQMCQCYFQIWNLKSSKCPKDSLEQLELLWGGVLLHWEWTVLVAFDIPQFKMRHFQICYYLYWEKIFRVNWLQIITKSITP